VYKPACKLRVTAVGPPVLSSGCWVAESVVSFKGVHRYM